MGFGTRLAGFHSSTIGRLGTLCTCHWYQWRMGSLEAFLGKIDFACFFWFVGSDFDMFLSDFLVVVFDVDVR